MSEGGHFIYEGELKGHRGWVTSIATPQDNNDSFLSASRDGTVLNWNRNSLRGAVDASDAYAVPVKRFEGHSGFIQDVALSHDATYALSGSWDKTLRLWTISTGQCRAVLRGHTKDVLSVAFSPDNRQIVSGARDGKIKMWNTHGECKFTFTEGGHTDWVTCVRFSPRAETPFIVSAGCDNLVKLWTLSPFRLATNFEGHTGYLNTVSVSPDGSLCASGGKDGITMLWDLSTGSHLYQLEAGEVIHSLTFSPNRYWLCAATESCIRIWDLESKKAIAELAPPRRHMNRKALKPECISLAWSMDGNTLYTGHTDNSVHIFGVRDN
jgi:guanine nucleotide-binding protein subunit beta-2-like 1 protein